MHRFLDRLEQLSKLSVYIIAFSAVILIGLLDYTSGSEISLSFFYLLPITIVVWKNGKTLGVLFSLVSTIIWFISNKFAGQEFSNILIFYWNAVVRFGFFLTTTFLLAEIRVLLEHEKILSRTDSLTGVLNRRAFYEFAEYQIESLKRVFRSFTVIYIDIDDFKNINDKLGHHTGDQLLQNISETISALIRSNDRLVRLGGDEFMLYLPETGTNASQIIVSRLLENLNKIMDKNKWRVTFSLGAITFFKIPDSVDEMIRIADELMYEAKKSGKNRTRYGIYE